MLGNAHLLDNSLSSLTERAALFGQIDYHCRFHALHNDPSI